VLQKGNERYTERKVEVAINNLRGQE